MKKILAGLVIAMSALSAQAISCAWDVGSNDWNSTVTSATIVWAASGTTLSETDLITAAKTTAESTLPENGYANVTKDFTFDKDNGQFVANLTEAITGTSMAGNYYVVFFDDDGNFHYNKTAMDGATDGTLIDISVGGSMPGPLTYTKVTIDGPGGAVPEPTVLALLALGVAGLALKRRV